MLNEKKIILMTKLAGYEQQEGKEDIRISKYYKADYIRYNLLKTLLGVTIAFVIITVMVGIYKSEKIIEKMVALDIKGTITDVLGIYIAVMVFYSVVSAVIFFIKYDISIKQLDEYLRSLHSLKFFYKDEAEHNRGDVTK